MSVDAETTLKTLKTYREIIDGLIAKRDGRLADAIDWDWLDDANAE